MTERIELISSGEQRRCRTEGGLVQRISVAARPSGMELSQIHSGRGSKKVRALLLSVRPPGPPVRLSRRTAPHPTPRGDTRHDAVIVLPFRGPPQSRHPDDQVDMRTGEVLLRGRGRVICLNTGAIL
jgi:hypothetical protein